MVGLAIDTVTRLQTGRAVAAFTTEPPVLIEVEAQKMVTKFRIKGPMSLRELSRCYNRQGFDRLEPILQHALGTGALRADGEFFTAVH